MNFIQIQKEVFDNLNLLSSLDDTSIREGKVTIAGVKRNINYIIREVLFNKLSDKFPEDFERETYPFPTYTATGVASTSSTTLTATTSIFDNSMEGFTVENATDNVSAVLKTYTSGKIVTLDEAPATAWSGDTIYVLGNEYTFGGNTTDIKIIKKVWVKYSSTDTDFVEAEFINQGDNRSYSKAFPVFYRTTINELDVNNVARPKPAFGILPYPDSYLGKIKIQYIEMPPLLTVDTDTPTLSVPGIGQCVVEGVTAWGLRKQKEFNEADKFDALYEKHLDSIIRNYRPKKYRQSRIEESPYWSAMRRGDI